VKPDNIVAEDIVNRFFQNIETRAWTDAEKDLDTIRQKSQNTPWYKGYVKALEGLLLTYRSNDDKYIYLPRALSNRTEESINQLRKEFGEFASNEIHGEYDRGYFKALEDYVSILPKIKPTQASEAATPPVSEEKTDEPKEKDEGLTPYLAESS
jgi:hypothetical protein